MSKPEKKYRGVYEKNPGSGVWYIRWKNEKGRIQKMMVGAKRDAIKAVEQKRARVRLAVIAPELVAEEVPDKTLAEVNAFRLETSLNKPRTKKQEKYLAGQWEGWLGDIYLKDITPAMIERWIAWRAQQVKPATVNRALAYLKTTFNLAIRHDWADSNPVSKVKLLKENNKRDRFYSPEEMTAILGKAAPYPAAIIEIAVQTGFRQSEQFALTRPDLNLTHGLARLPNTKAGELQWVELNARAVELFAMVLASHSEHHVFPSFHPRFQGRPMKARWFVDTVFKPILEKLGIKDAGWHTLRHTFASWLRLEGVDLKTIADLCRHSNQSTTERYAHLNAHGRRTAANSIAHLTERAGEEWPVLRLVQ